MLRFATSAVREVLVVCFFNHWETVGYFPSVAISGVNHLLLTSLGKIIGHCGWSWTLYLPGVRPYCLRHYQIYW